MTAKSARRRRSVPLRAQPESSLSLVLALVAVLVVVLILVVVLVLVIILIVVLVVVLIVVLILVVVLVLVIILIVIHFEVPPKYDLRLSASLAFPFFQLLSFGLKIRAIR